MWIDFISCLDNMWDISDFAEEMQQIWDHVFPTLEHTISKNKDAVYKVVSLLWLTFYHLIMHFIQLMQHAYDYCSNFGERAEIVVTKYIWMQDWSPDNIIDTVAYLVPEQAQYVDEASCTTWVNPPIYPYMWKLVVSDRTDMNVCVLISSCLDCSPVK